MKQSLPVPEVTEHGEELLELWRLEWRKAHPDDQYPKSMGPEWADTMPAQEQ